MEQSWPYLGDGPVPCCRSMYLRPEAVLKTVNSSSAAVDNGALLKRAAAMVAHEIMENDRRDCCAGRQRGDFSASLATPCNTIEFRRPFSLEMNAPVYEIRSKQDRER